MNQNHNLTQRPAPFSLEDINLLYEAFDAFFQPDHAQSTSQKAKLFAYEKKKDGIFMKYSIPDSSDLSKDNFEVIVKDRGLTIRRESEGASLVLLRESFSQTINTETSSARWSRDEDNNAVIAIDLRFEPEHKTLRLED